MKKFWNYLKTFFRIKSEKMKDPEVEIEQAIHDARQRDQQLRTQAAKVIAHRTQVQAELEQSAGEVAEARELAKQALLKADGATKTGNAADATKWTQAAQTLGMKLTASQNNVDMLKKQYELATTQAEQAKQAVNQNAMSLQEMSAKRIELLGKLEAAKMQESVNKAMDSMNAQLQDDAPSMREVEDKIQKRMAEAQAKTELTEATPEGAMAELKQSVSLTKADAVLDDLRKELGLTPGASAELPPGGTPSA